MELAEIKKLGGEKVYSRSPLLTDNVMHYCPGCTHGVIHKVLAEEIDKMGIQEDVIGVSPVGCSVLAYNYLQFDWQEAAHGRAPACATAISRLRPDKLVFTYQGDGDLASIGCAEIIHACNRGENMVVIFVNNGIYGMTGGQMAPTTLPGMKTATCPEGRDVSMVGAPLVITELIAQLPGTCYVARHSAHTPATINKLRQAIQKAFKNTKEKKGTSFIEVVSTCNSGWKMTPVKSNEWMVENMFPMYKPGVLKDE
ncbi:MAG: 2-oxoglutarate oxidoreductase [Bacteroidetes bacterium]|nr:MAG: 2-oxoglutarate oxidoreductase [Bacteroidota bacterium]